MVVKKKRRVPWGWIWALFLVGGGAGYWFWDQQARAGNANKLPPGVQVGKAERGNIDQKITATGVVAAQTGAKVNIGARVSGRIRSLPADVGTLVRANQVVAILETPELQAQVEQQRQSVAGAEANVQQAESRLEQAKLNATLSVDQTRAQIEEASSALQGASERLQMAEAAAQMQPTQTATEIARAEAALSTARSQERQVQQTVNLQLLQAQTAIDDGRAAREIAQKNVKRQVGLLAQGYTSQQDADEARTVYRQAVARLQNSEAALDILKQKTQADLQAAKDQVAQAEATLTAAKAGKFQNLMRAAEERSARQARKQSEASLALRRSNRTQDVVRRSGVVEAKSALVQARASLQQARAQLQFQEAQLAYGVIRSPITGTVLTITAQQGETLTAGFQTPTLMTVAALNRLEVRAYVDEVDVGRVRLGLPTEVRVESFQGRVFNGRVTKVASASTVKDNVVTYETTIAIDNAQGLLRPDMTADVTLILGRTRDVLLIPTEAIHREVGRSLVYVLHPNKTGKERVETRTVTTGVQDGSFTQILSGIKEGEQVVLAGLQRLGVKAVDAQDAEGKKEN